MYIQCIINPELMPTDMKTSVSKWGNSLGVRIPKPFADEAGLTPGEIVEMILNNWF